MKQIFLLSGLVFFLIHCSQKQDMDEVKQLTKDIKETTDTMGRSTEQLKDHTGDFYQDSREIISSLNQKISFSQVLSAQQTSQKLQIAKQYFASMEFQLWRGPLQESVEGREMLLTKAVNDFFAEVSSFIQGEMPIDTPLLPPQTPWWGKGFERWHNLSTLSVAMSAVNETQLQMAFQHSIPAYSLYDIIKEALLLREDYAQGKKTPSYVEAVLRYESEAIYLLQLRHNFYPLILVNQLRKSKEGWWTMAKIKFLVWEIDPISFNKAQYGMFEENLQKGFATRKFLESLQIPLVSNQWVDEIFKNLRWVITDSEPFRSLITQMGMNPGFDEVEKFRVRLHNPPQVSTDPEKLVVLVNEYTGATLFVFNKLEAQKVEENESQRRKEEKKIRRERQREVFYRRFREKDLGPIGDIIAP